MKQVEDLKQLLEAAAEKHADKTAVICGERRLSYTELDEAASRMAGAFVALGVEKGDRIATLMNNSPEFIIIYFGIIKAGAIPVPLDVRYKIVELALVLDSCRPRVLVAESDLLQPLVPMLSRFKYVQRVVDLGGRCGRQFPSYEEILANNTVPEVEIAPEPDDIGIISYTSGPTNRPRGAAISQRNLVLEAIVSGEGFQQTEDDRLLLFALPMYHQFGL
ncbi:MAG: AMP-binding protein, partial [Chloroflexi bacterium]|nr:AMP-binding protein [Chloroflexota bacterium]